MEYIKKRIYLFLILILVSGFFISVSSDSLQAATLLQDDFTGTTINTTKWTEFDSAGAGGTAGDIQQNGTLTAANGFVGSIWGARALISADTFDSDGLEISATITRNSDALIGYGDINFQTAGTKTYIIDVLQSGGVLALVWNNGGLAGNTSCGTATDGATYKMKILASSFEVYKNDVLQCTQSTTGVPIDNENIYLQSSAAASVYDDVLVIGNASGPTAPAQVGTVVADAGDAQVGLAWTAPTNGGSAIIDYLVEYKLNSEPTTWTTFADGTSTDITTTVTGLTNNLLYNFRISAINGVGTGTASSTVSATPTAPAAPGAPTGLTPTPGNTQVGLSWTAPSSNGSAITDYIIEYKLNVSGSWTTFVDGTSTSTSTTVTGLTNDALYNFRVSAVNGIGTGAASSAANATPVAIGVVLSDTFTGTTIDTNKWIEEDDTGAGGTTGKITQDGSLSISDSFVSGTWGATYLVSQESFDATNLEISADMVNNTAQLIGYGDPIFGDVANKAYLLYVTGAGNGQAVWALSWVDGNYTVTTGCGTSTSGANYKMKVIGDTFEVYKNDVLQCTHDANFVLDNKQVFMQAQATASTFDNFRVYGIQVADSAPDAPTIGTATSGNQQATVTFTPPSDNGGDPITGYTVTSSPGGVTASGSSSPIIVTGLTNGTSYTFSVTATNGVGTSIASAASNSITPSLPDLPGQVAGLTSTGVNQQVLLSWTAVTAADPVSDYKVEYKLATDSSWSTFADGTSTATKTIVTGLANGSSYNFRVSAMNSAGFGTVSSASTASPKEITNLAFVITGESNSGGIGLNSDATSGELAVRPAVQIMNLTSGQFLFESLDIGTNNLRDHSGLEGYYDNSHGFELQLANSTEAHAFPDNPTVYLTKTGHGGSQVSQWTVGNGSGFWTKFLQRTASAKTNIPSDGRQWVVFLSLGINDAIAGVPTSTWKTAMTAHLDKIKTDLPGAIIILTEFQSMTNQSGYATYNAVMEELAAEQANVFAVSSTGAALRDTNHWSYAGLKTVTSRMITLTKDKLGLNNPGKPTSLGATPSGTSVALAWTAPVSNGGSAITDYRVQYKLNSANTWTTFADGTSTTPSTTVTGLTGGTAYDFRVATSSSAGTGNYATVSSTTTDGDAPVISDITTEVTDTTITTTWSTNESSSTRAEYGLTDAYGELTSETNTTPRVTEHAVTISNLLPCTVYQLRAVSRDSALNSGMSTNQEVVTSGCASGGEVTETATEFIDASTGGTAELVGTNAQISLNVPAGATVGDTYYQIKTLDTDVFQSLPLVNGKRRSNFIIDLKAISDVNTAGDTQFDEDIEITISFDPQLINGLDRETVSLWHYTGGVWEALDCILDPVDDLITCTTDAFSMFALFGTSSSSQSTSGSIVKSKVDAHEAGINIKTSDGTIYTITPDKQRRPYTSAGAFLSYGFNNFASVVDANEGDLQLPVGLFVTPRDGSIVCSDRGTDKGTCYLITEGKKAGFTSATIFKALGFSFIDAINGDVSFMPTTDAISSSQQAHKIGTLINNAGTLQIVATQALIGIPSMQVLTSWGYNPARAVLANSFDKAYAQIKVLGERVAGTFSF